ncbi:MAG: hypothetical protein Rubg2KO_03420 [Rubricoccaceae bacterium]
MRFSAVLGVLLAASACATLSAPIDLVRLQTEESAYVAAVSNSTLDFSLSFRYINFSGRTAYLHGCHPPAPPSIDKQVDGEWVPVYDPIVLACLSPPAEVEAETVLRQQTRVFAGFPGGNWRPEWGTSDAAGTYRLRWRVEERRQHITVFSNPFTLSTRRAE